jgi:hypothetical protein
LTSNVLQCMWKENERGERGPEGPWIGGENCDSGAYRT